MKTSEEIEKMALGKYPPHLFPNQVGGIDNASRERTAFKKGYTQCQEDVLVDGIDTLFVEGYNQCQFDNSDKKYTEEDLHTILRLRREWYSHTDKNVVRDFLKEINNK